jgi:hypothetical protein
VYNYHDSRAYDYKRSRILPRIDGMVLGSEWLWNGCSMILDQADFGIALRNCVI